MSAYFSEDRVYRYSLTRNMPPPLDEGQGYLQTTCTFIGLNPSTAIETRDDPTIRRCMRFARDWGFTRLKMVNLYAYRATDPRSLWLADDPVGPENDHNLSLAFGDSDLIVAAWGANARADRVKQFAVMFRGWQLHALGLTKDGAPRHPLYLRADTIPIPFDAMSVS